MYIQYSLYLSLITPGRLSTHTEHSLGRQAFLDMDMITALSNLVSTITRVATALYTVQLSKAYAYSDNVMVHSIPVGLKLEYV